MNPFWAGLVAIIIGVILFWGSWVTDIPEIDLLFPIISITASSVLDPNPNYLINTTILLCQFRSHMTFLNKTNYATVFYTAHSSFEHYRVHLHDNSCS